MNEKAVAKQRNGEIDLIRFLFSIVILLHHFGNDFSKNIFKYGNIGVEFFFLVSGFLMAKSAEKNWNIQPSEIAGQTWKFVFHKITAFYPYYICGTLFSAFIMRMLFNGHTIKKMILSVFRSIPNWTLLMMPLTNNSNTFYLSASWYLSAMIVSMFVLYPLLLKLKKSATDILFPVIFMLSIGYLYGNYKTLLVTDKWNGWIRIGMLRAIGEISLGVCAYRLSQLLCEKVGWLINTKNHALRLFMTLFKYGLYAVIFYYCNGHEMDGNFSIHALLLLAIAVLLSFSEFGITLPSSRLTEQLGKYSLSIYIFHGTFRYVFTGALKNIGKDPKSIGNDTFILFTLITLAMCVILTLLTDFMKPHCRSLYVRFKGKLSE